MKNRKILFGSIKLFLITALVVLLCNLSKVTNIFELKDIELNFVNQLMIDFYSCLTLTIFWEHVILAIELVWVLWITLLKIVWHLVSTIFGNKNKKQIKKVNSQDIINSHNTVTSNPRRFTRIVNEH